LDLVQLVSFGCGVDAITSDETREILLAVEAVHPAENRRDHHLGAVRIRLRSLFAAWTTGEQAPCCRKGG
jgi:predicted nucleotide-binding protein (sugar kinase/HSP70/actin superfamily)